MQLVRTPLASLRKCSADHFDPRLVAALARVSGAAKRQRAEGRQRCRLLVCLNKHYSGSP